MWKMGLLGKKLGMTQTYNDEGFRVPVSVLQMGPCTVLAKRTPDRDGYSAIQLGFDDQKASRVNRPDLARFEKAKAAPKRFVREIRLEPEHLDRFEVGQDISVAEVFAKGDVVDVTGTSQGKGFQGVMKKFHFRGFRATHGTHEFFRHGGSIGCRLTPGRVVKGKAMPGQLGRRRVTQQNLTVVDVRPDDNVLLIKGGVPTHANGYLIVRYAKKKPNPQREAAEA